MFTKRLATRLSVLIIFILAVSSLNSGVAQASPNYIEGTDPGAVIYDPLHVSKISLQMSNSDYNSLRWPNVSWDNEGDWRETQMRFTMGSKTYGPYKVGVHLKGAWGSWRDVSGKAAFKIKVDAFVENQSFLGITRMTLNNMVQDNSYIHETLTYRLFRAVGVPAPRTGFADVTLNGIDYGLHLNVETISPKMLKRWNITSSQMVKGAVPTFPDFWPGSESSFAIESGIKDSYSSLTAFIDANQLDGDLWWQQINQIADMKEMTLEWATELYTGHWDGYALNKNNYFVNFDEDGRAILLPWGTDQTWNGNYDYFSASGLMLNKCWNSTECHELYLQSLAKVANKAKALDLQLMASSVSTAIRNSIAQDGMGPGLETAQDAQYWTVEQLNSQLSILSSMTQPWDTTLAKTTINGITFDPDRLVLLSPGTKRANLITTPTQPDAKTQSKPIASFKPGLNKVDVTVISADGQHSKVYNLSFYVLTKRTNLTKLSFATGKAKLTSDSINKANSLASKYQGVDSLILNLTISKNQPNATTLLEQRAQTLIALLKVRGITPMKVTKTLTSTGSNNTLTVSGSYRN